MQDNNRLTFNFGSNTSETDNEGYFQDSLTINNLTEDKIPVVQNLYEIIRKIIPFKKKIQ